MRRTLVLALVLAALPGAARAAAPQPVVQGARMVDARTGATWVARGANWPSFEYACEQGWGYSSDGANAASAAAIAAWHMTAVRIPLNQDCWLGDDGQPAFGTVAGYRAAVQSFVTALEGAGLVPILDLHWSGPNGVVANGQRALGDDRSPAFWTSVAAAYHDDASVLFDAFNEPYSRYDGDTLTFDLTWSCWRDGGAACGAGAPKQNDMEAPFDGTRFTPAGMAALVSAIRGAGAPQPILLGGVDYSNDLRQWLASRPADTQLVASFHNYDGQRCAAQSCWDAEIAPVAATVPVITGEFGETDCGTAHDTSYMTWADAHGVGYLGWAWWVIGGDCHTLALISDAAGTPRAPNGTALRAHLDALADVVPPPPGGGPGPAPKPPPIARAASKLRLRSIHRHGRTLQIRGRLTPALAASVTVRVTYTPRHRRHRKTLRRTARTSKTGAFAIAVRLAAGAKPRSVSIAFAGTAAVAPSHARRGL